MVANRKTDATQVSIWDCKVCVDQMFGGVRCFAHNPTPEMREADPDKYRREHLGFALRNPDEDLQCRCGWLGMAEETRLTWVDYRGGSALKATCPRCKQYIKFVKQA